jgi:hypothetical protein
MAIKTAKSNDEEIVKLVRDQSKQTREDFYEGDNEVEVQSNQVQSWLDSGWGWEKSK